MKKFVSVFIAITLVYLMLVSCERKGEAPELPPYESMFVDFSKFDTNATKLATSDLKSTLTDSMSNYNFARANVGYFSLILGVILAVPVETFALSFQQEPTFLGDATWQWSSSYPVFGGTYHARLTGEVRSDDVKWEMYISRDGIGAFTEFLWYEGTSQSDGSGGQWILNHSQLYPEPMLQIDWELIGDEVGDIKFSNVRELNDARVTNPHFGDWIEVGHTTEEGYDTYYNIHVFNEWPVNGIIDVNIDWNSTQFNGSVQCPVYYGDDEWRCWDNYGYNTAC